MNFRSPLLQQPLPRSTKPLPLMGVSQDAHGNLLLIEIKGEGFCLRQPVPPEVNAAMREMAQLAQRLQVMPTKDEGNETLLALMLRHHENTRTHAH